MQAAALSSKDVELGEQSVAFEQTTLQRQFISLEARSPSFRVETFLDALLGAPAVADGGLSRAVLMDALVRGGLDGVGEDPSGFVDYLFLQDTSGGNPQLLPLADFLCGMIGITSDVSGFAKRCAGHF